jgi:hypothetical protein
VPTAVKIAFLIAFAAAFIFPLLNIDRYNRRANESIKSIGYMTEAEILGYEKTKYLYVRYKFTPEGTETPIVVRKRVGGKKLRIGSVVRVWHLRNAPSISVLEPYLSSQDASS